MQVSFLEDIFYRIDELLLLKLNRPVICAIDGGCASGKTSLSELLAQHYTVTVIHLDDFFLRPEQRTQARLSEIAGNIDYERFTEEVLNPLKLGNPIFYRPYDCRKEILLGAVTPRKTPIVIIEGVYSLRPDFQSIYDLKIFLKTSVEEQKRRLMTRNAKLYPRFEQEWIPMENQYFNSCSIESLCDFVFNTERE